MLRENLIDLYNVVSTEIPEMPQGSRGTCCLSKEICYDNTGEHERYIYCDDVMKEFPSYDDAVKSLHDAGYTREERKFGNFSNGFSSQIFVNKEIKTAYDKKMILYNERKEQFSNAMSEILNTFSTLLEKNCEKTYIRFGKIPKDERSYNFREEKYEKGVSVFTAYKFNNDYIVDVVGGILTYAGYIKNKSAYEVRGSEIGKGGDGEPLLVNCATVKEINQNNLYHFKQFINKLFENSEELVEELNKDPITEYCKSVSNIELCAKDEQEK